MIKSFLHIIRWPNLLMLGGIQCLIYIRLLEPKQSSLHWQFFAVLSLITILLAAGGYVINDFYDHEIDRINKPHRVIAGYIWPLPKVKMFYVTLTGLGAVLSAGLAWKLGLMAYLMIYPIAVAGLWYYSKTLKCVAFIGNIWVSLFCAGVVGVVALPDLLLENTQHIKAELWYFMVFAFLSTWYREVVKDMEDEEGDESVDCRTAVVRYGIKAGKIMAVALGMLLLASLLFWDSGQTGRWIKLGLNGLQGFTVASVAFVWWAKNTTYYHQASNVIKLVMVAGTVILLCM